MRLGEEKHGNSTNRTPTTHPQPLRNSSPSAGQIANSQKENNILSNSWQQLFGTWNGDYSDGVTITLGICQVPPSESCQDFKDSGKLTRHNWGQKWEQRPRAAKASPGLTCDHFQQLLNEGSSFKCLCAPCESPADSG